MGVGRGGGGVGGRDSACTDFKHSYDFVYVPNFVLSLQFIWYVVSLSRIWCFHGNYILTGMLLVQFWV